MPVTACAWITAIGDVSSSTTAVARRNHVKQGRRLTAWGGIGSTGCFRDSRQDESRWLALPASLSRDPCTSPLSRTLHSEGRWFGRRRRFLDKGLISGIRIYGVCPLIIFVVQMMTIEIEKSKVVKYLQFSHDHDSFEISCNAEIPWSALKMSQGCNFGCWNWSWTLVCTIGTPVTIRWWSWRGSAPNIPV